MGTVIATVIVLAAVILAFIWTRTGNRKAGGKCSQNSGGCATCDDTACPASKTAGYTHSDGISGRRFDAVFFDMDGTLLDTAGDLTAAMNYVRGIHGLPLVPEDRVIPELGNGIINLLRKLLPENITEEEFKTCIREFSDFYAEHSQKKTYAYDGIRNLLAELKAQNYKVAVITNKNDDVARVLSSSFFPGLLDFTLGRTDFLERKPAPAMMRYVLSRLELDPGRVLYVGDSEVDYEFASAAGVPCVLVSWGFRDRNELVKIAGEKGVADVPSQIGEVL